jgi:hypothetical protein
MRIASDVLASRGVGDGLHSGRTVVSTNSRGWPRWTVNHVARSSGGRADAEEAPRVENKTTARTIELSLMTNSFGLS